MKAKSLILFAVLLLTLKALAVANYTQWRQTYWQGNDATNPLVSGPEADPDVDGLSNALEYATGLHPLLPGELPIGMERSVPWALESHARFAIGMPYNPQADQAVLTTELSRDLVYPSWEVLQQTPLTPALTADGGLRGQVLLPGSILGPDSRRAFLQVHASVEEPEYVWVEAEDYTDSSDTGREEHPVVSNGAWIDLLEADPRYIEWDNIEIPSDGTYHIYVRKFWKHGPFRWSINGSTDPTLSGRVPFDVSLLDSRELYTFRVVNWVYLDAVDLTAGRHHFRIEQETVSGAAAYDVVLFIKGHFEPRGSLRPEEPYPSVPEAGYFPFRPTRDTFRPSPMDLSHLNEEAAGSRGFIRAEGHQFVYPDNGEPVRFWGINVTPEVYTMDNERIRHLARFLAKRGVNAVRLHGPFYEEEGPDAGRVKDHVVERIFHAVHAFKEEGIYSLLGIYFPLWLTLSAEDTRFPGYDDSTPFAIIYFNETFQEMYREWWDALLLPVNPYTGLRLAEDPAVLACELVNEDSYLFWTFDGGVPDEQKELLEARFAQWLVAPERYGSANAALAAWQADPFWEPLPRDNPGVGRLGVLPSWELAFGPNSLRMRDTLRFLVEDMRGFYEYHRDYLKNTLGYRGLVQGTNWITASPTRLGPLEKWANASMDFLDRHGYFDTAHGGFSASYAVAGGNIYQNRSALRFDDRADAGAKEFGNPVMAISYANKPSIISEINWPEPNAYRADVVPYVATYAALQGVDGIFFYRADSDSWDANPTNKFPMQTPGTFTQFPAAALIHRRGLVQTPQPAVEVQLHMENLWQFEGTPMPQPQNLDNLRDPGIGGGENSASALSFLTGPVNVEFLPGAGETAFTDRSQAGIDTNAQTVASLNQQVRLDYGTGLLTVNAPQVQGIVGFLSERDSHQLDSLTIVSSMEHAAILAVSLDDRPLAESRSILVQVTSEDRMNGFTTRPATQADLDAVFEGEAPEFSEPLLIESLGAPPLMVREFQGTLQFNRPDASDLMVFACDINGYPTGPVGAADTFTLRPDVFYYYIQPLGGHP